MPLPSKSPYQYRHATPEDIPALIEMIRELAVFEHLEHLFVATEADFQESLFGPTPAAEALIAEGDTGPVAYAIFFTNFSTFLGRPGIWLEDLYVRPAHRGQGLGKGLLKAVGTIAKERSAGRYEWTVLDWNQRAIDLYESVGGEILEEWRIVRMDEKRLHQFLES